MSFESDLAAKLEGVAAIAALVGDRIYPLVLKQNGAFPAITYQRISNVSDQDNDGASGTDAVRVQFDLWASTYDETRQLREALVTALQGFSGTFGSTGVPDVTYLDDGDFYEPDTKLYRSSVDMELAVYV